MLNLRALHNNRGDTIVEVLIAISIISAVLAGAYVSANRSSQAIRTAQERGEALKLAESQVEQIKIARNANKTLPASPTTFCFVGATVDTDPSHCKNGNVGYTAGITQQPTPNTTSYVVVVSWDGLGGENNNVELDYKIP